MPEGEGSAAAPPYGAPGPVRCANCEAPLAGQFCAGCGQRAAAGAPLRTPQVLREALGSFVDLDRPVLRTLRGLSTHPGRVCLEYANGRRASYANPFKYALACSAILVLVAGLLGPELVSGFSVSSGSARQAEAEALSRAVRQQVLAHLSLSLFAALPLWALALRVLFQASRRTFAEHFTFALFIGGHAALLRSLVMPLLSTHPVIAILAATGLEWGLAFWASGPFYAGTGVSRLWKTLVAEVVLRAAVILVSLGISLFVLLVYPGAWRERAADLLRPESTPAAEDEAPAPPTPESADQANDRSGG